MEVRDESKRYRETSKTPHPECVGMDGEHSFEKFRNDLSHGLAYNRLIIRFVILIIIIYILGWFFINHW